MLASIKSQLKFQSAKKILKIIVMVFLGVFLVAVLAAALAYLKFQPSKPPVLQAFINANVLTVNDSNDKAEAILIEHDKIIAVGSTQDITALIQAHKSKSDVMVHDLLGKTLMPGIIDAHSHFPGSGVVELAADLNAPPIGGVTSIDQMLERLRKLDREQLESGKDDEEWIFGLGYDDSQMIEKRHPLREELDAISTQRPIFILHVSGHMGVANSKALERMRVGVETVAPEGGEYGKNKAGQLNGLILETAVFPFLAAATDFSLSEVYTVVKAASQEYAAQGITTAQNGAADARYIVGLKWAVKLGLVPQRVIVWPMHQAMSDSELQTLRAQSTDKFEVGATKLIADGSIQGYTGYLAKPYHVAPELHNGNHHSHNSQSNKGFVGKPVIERAALVKLVTDYYATGQQLAIHGNGDASIDDIIFAVEKAREAYPNSDPRTILIHAQMARQDQLKKMIDLGITPSFFSAHTYYWGDRHRDIFMGPERANAISPARSAKRLGLRFSIHLDSPVVPMQPMRLLWSAVTRESSSGRIIGRRERVSRTDALRAITIDAAYQVFREQQLGSIEVGKFADLVVLDQDPTSEKVSLLDVTVLNTYVGGVEIYQR